MNDIARPAPPILPIDRSLRLPDDQYVMEETPKSAVYLHHTVGGSARSTFNWWLDDPRRIATPYIIARDGTIYEVFDPKYWAWHLGIKDSNEERRTIGIELASEGGLIRRGQYLYAFDGAKRLYHLVNDEGKYYDHGTKYRGYRYFDAYDDAQFESLWKLCIVLSVDFEIERRTPADHFNTDLRKWHGFEGFLSHVHVRTDKNDVHPGFNWNEFNTHLNMKLV